MFDLMVADHIQPDISHAGGIMDLKKIANAYGLSVEELINEMESAIKVSNTDITKLDEFILSITAKVILEKNKTQ